MRRLTLIFLLCLAQIIVRAQFPSHNITICAIPYQVKASIQKQKHIHYYKLTISTAGRPDRELTLGKLVDDNSRASILKSLQDSLHKANLFTFCPAGYDLIDQDIDNLIRSLINEVYPHSNVITIDQQIINENNKLRLLQATEDTTYQLSSLVVLPAPPPPPPPAPLPTRTSLVSYNTATHRYDCVWANFTPLILEYFDKFMRLYYQIPSVKEKPILYMDGTYRIFYSYDGHNALPAIPVVILPLETGKRLAGPTINTISVGGAATILYTMKNPNDTVSPKKAKDDPSFTEQ